MELKIAVLILGYNHKKTLRDTVDSVLEQVYKNYSVTYIDNASQDGSVEYIKEHFPTINVVANRDNLGYAGGYDAILRLIFTQDFDAAVLLNPDTIVDRHWLAELIKSAYSAPEIALAQSKVLIWSNGPTEIINTFGNKVHFLGFGFCGNYRQLDTFFEDLDVPYASGSSLLIKKEYYPSAISFDTDFFAYLEDQDLGWQAHMQGLRVIASARSKVWHKYEFRKRNCNDFKFYLLERNRLFFLTKYWSRRMQYLILPAFVIMEVGVFLDSIKNGYFIRKLTASWDFFLSIPNLYRKRAKIRQIRTVTDVHLSKFLCSTIEFEEVDSLLLRAANRAMGKYYKMIQRFL